MRCCLFAVNSASASSLGALSPCLSILPRLALPGAVKSLTTFFLAMSRGLLARPLDADKTARNANAFYSQTFTDESAPIIKR